MPITQFHTITPLSQKPPIKVIKSSTNGFVSAYSDVPKLNATKSTFHDTSSPYAALDFDTSHDTDYRPTPEPTNDIVAEVPLYSQVEKGRRRNTRPPSANSTNNNINIIYKQPMNESIQSNASNASTYRSLVDGKVYDVKTKDYGFSVATNPNAPRFNLSNPMSSSLTNSGAYLGDSTFSSSRMGSSVTSPRLAAYNTGSYRDLHDIPLTPTPTNVEKEIIEETISISNASTEENRTVVPPYRPTGSGNTLKVPQQHGYGDNLSYTSKTSSNYGRRESPVRPYNGSLSKQPSPYSTLEQQNTLTKNKKPLKKKKVLKSDENVLLANNSLRLKSSRSDQHRVQPSERLYKSNADLRDQFMRDETRGGLAAAYNRRQPAVQPQQQTNRQRALSLNRMNASFDDDADHHHHSYNTYQNGPPPHQLLPTRYHSQTHLNGGTSSRLSDSSSYHRGGHRNHERDPIVMYIPPTVNHRDQPKLTSILRNNSTKSTVVSGGGTLPSSSKKKAAVTKSQSKTNLKEAAAKEKEKEKEKAAAAAKKKADLNRRHSMPKDAKLNGASGSWFSKFKLKSNK